jgi:hypothetical protein
MMGRLNHDQKQVFYSFCLDWAVPDGLDALVEAQAHVRLKQSNHQEINSTGRPYLDAVVHRSRNRHGCCRGGA